MQKSQLLGKYSILQDQITALKQHLAGPNYSPKTTSSVINNNLSDYLVKSKYGKVLPTALYQQNYVVFLSSKRGVRPPNPSPLGVPLYVCYQIS